MQWSPDRHGQWAQMAGLTTHGGCGQRSLWQQTPAPLLLLFKLILHLEKGQLGQVFRNDLLVLT